jgi:enamine deaminase RidA (YjgF/YER057c/UK114 family)
MGGGSDAPRRIYSGSTFERDIGYARAVIAGGFVFVSGTTGYDYATMTLAEGVVAQCGQALANIKSALAKAGAGLDDVVRVRYILPNRDDFPLCWGLLREAFGWRRRRQRWLLRG